MNIEYNKSFCKTQNLINYCRQISEICNKYDNLCNPFFIDDEYKDFSDYPCIYLALEDEKIIGFLSVFVIDDYNVELCGFVLPQYRRNEIASNLFYRMVMDFHTASFRLPMAVDNEAGENFASKMGFLYGATECSMQLQKNCFQPDFVPVELSPHKEDDQIEIAGFIDGIQIGRVIISAFDMSVCIHDVEVIEQFRRNGYGFRIMCSVLKDIFKKYDKAILHVTKENVPAYNLYQKLGFEELEVLKYFEI